MMLPDSIANNGFKKQKQKLYVLLIHTLIFGRVMYLQVFASECFSQNNNNSRTKGLNSILKVSLAQNGKTALLKSFVGFKF